MKYEILLFLKENKAIDVLRAVGEGRKKVSESEKKLRVIRKNLENLKIRRLVNFLAQ